MRKTGIYFWVMAALCIAGCKKDTFTPEESFIKVYDDQTANRKYFPIDVVQTSDGGYIILCARDTWDIYIMKTDKEGIFEWEYFTNTPYVNPVGDIIELNGKYYFFCMDRVGLFTYLMEIDMSGNVSQVAAYNDVVYPLSACSTSDGGMLVQNYNRYSYRAGIHKIDGSLAKTGGNEFYIFESVEDEVVGHITRQGQHFPTFSGEFEDHSKYYFNSFYNYSFSLVFVNTSDLSFSGVYNGSNYNGGASSYLQANGQNIVSRFSFGANFINLNAPVNPTVIGFTDDLGGTGITEMADNAPVKSLKTTVEGHPIVFFLTETKSNKILLMGYDLSLGQITGKKYLGNTNPHHIGNISTTSDGGLVVVGQVMVNSSFPRVTLFKITDEEVMALAGLEE